jgi:hypothetical protein
MIEFLKSCWYNDAVKFVMMFLFFLVVCFTSAGIISCLALHYFLGLTWLISSISGILIMGTGIFIYMKI